MGKTFFSVTQTTMKETKSGTKYNVHVH